MPNTAHKLDLLGENPNPVQDSKQSEFIFHVHHNLDVSANYKSEVQLGAPFKPLLRLRIFLRGMGNRSCGMSEGGVVGVHHHSCNVNALSHLLGLPSHEQASAQFCGVSCLAAA